MPIKRLFIANRGEIAVRIIRAAKAMGVHTIQAHSEADADMLAVRLADEAVCIGPAQAAKSYLNVEAVVAAAKATNADAVHPGYGFLAENAGFVRTLDAEGITFVGPSAETIGRMGDKVAARQAAEAAGVPVVPGSKGRLETTDEAVRVAGDVGYPVMIKAAAGGGGKGIRIAQSEVELRKMAPQAAMVGSIWNGRSSRRATSKCRSWAMALTRCISSSVNARCSAEDKRSGKKRALIALMKPRGRICAIPPWRWRGP